MEVNSRKKNSILIYDMGGEFSRSDEIAATIHQRVKDQFEIGRKYFIFNFEKLSFIDSFGIGELVACYISISKIGGKLKIIRIPAKILMLFRIFMLDKIFEIFDDEETAIKSFIEQEQKV
ncbi:MAG: STAS domain-containing protein [Candidatus Aminicenantes bacterium]|nr:STAS domain-containing protein [Candidatus Aminicenantes bacterium]